MAVNAKRTVENGRELRISTICGHWVLKNLHIEPRWGVAIKNYLMNLSIEGSGKLKQLSCVFVPISKDEVLHITGTSKMCTVRRRTTQLVDLLHLLRARLHRRVDYYDAAAEA